MASFNDPTNSTLYTAVLSTIRSLLASCIKLDPTSDTNLPTNAMRHSSSSNNKFQKWNGSAWVDADVHFGNDVGIGTTSPDRKLDVTYTNTAGGTAEMGVIVQNTATTNSTGVALKGQRQWDIWIEGSNGGGGALVFRDETGSANRVYFDESGNVIIGDDTALKKLHVECGNDDGIIINSTSSRPTLYFGRSDVQKALIWVDGGAFNTGSDDSLACRAGASGGVYLASTGTSWTAISDTRFKKNIQVLEYGLAEIVAMDTIRFDYLDDEGDSAARIGFSAQSVLPLVPEAVQGSEATRYGLSSTELIPVLVNAIKELKSKNDALEARIAALEAP